MFELTETTVIPSIFGFVDEYLIRPPSPLEHDEDTTQQSPERSSCPQGQECSTEQ